MKIDVRNFKAMCHWLDYVTWDDKIEILENLSNIGRYVIK